MTNPEPLVLGTSYSWHKCRKDYCHQETLASGSTSLCVTNSFQKTLVDNQRRTPSVWNIIFMAQMQKGFNVIKKHLLVDKLPS